MVAPIVVQTTSKKYGAKSLYVLPSVETVPIVGSREASTAVFTAGKYDCQSSNPPLSHRMCSKSRFLYLNPVGTRNGEIGEGAPPLGKKMIQTNFT